ncbi:MAG: hypothetical protein ABI679_05560 [Gemmatimonadota bacterium]
MKTSIAKQVIAASVILVVLSTLPRLPWQSLGPSIGNHWPLLATLLALVLSVLALVLGARRRPRNHANAAHRLANRGAELSAIARKTGMAQDAVRTLLAGDPASGRSCRPGRNGRPQLLSARVRNFLEGVKRQVVKASSHHAGSPACPLPLHPVTTYTGEKKS